MIVGIKIWISAKDRTFSFVLLGYEELRTGGKGPGASGRVKAHTSRRISPSRRNQTGGN